MNLLLIEDEPQAVERMLHLLRRVRPDDAVVAVKDSVSESVAWLKDHPQPDLILMDIQLADGLSFEIFDRVHVTCPVIFTTAYDEYALKAFKVNSIDYVLKPVDEEGLKAAFTKLTTLQTPGAAKMMESIAEAMRMMKQRYKERFLVSIGERLISVASTDVLFFLSEEKATYIHNRENRRLLIDFTLDQLEPQMDPDRFFRINRKYIVSRGAILEMRSHSNSRIRLILSGNPDPDVIVARERAGEFRAWMDS